MVPQGKAAKGLVVPQGKAHHVHVPGLKLQHPPQVGLGLGVALREGFRAEVSRATRRRVVYNCCMDYDAAIDCIIDLQMMRSADDEVSR